MALYNFSLRLSFSLLLILISSTKIEAQNSSLELWPETDIWYKVNPGLRLSSFIALTKYCESRNRDLNITLQADHAWGHTKNPFVGRLQDENRIQLMKAWMIRGGFMEGQSLGDHGENYSEDMALAEVHKRIPIKKNWLLSARFRTDLRWIGHSSDFSYRLRYRMMIEKEFNFGENSFVPYVNIEPYWDSRYSIINRIRFIGGATELLGNSFALEANFTYQHDSKSSIENVYALNIILHIFFERKSEIIKTQGSRITFIDFNDLAEIHK